MWLLPLLILGTSVVLAFPIGLYMAWIMDGHHPSWLRRLDALFDTGPQDWKQYCWAFMLGGLKYTAIAIATTRVVRTVFSIRLCPASRRPAGRSILPRRRAVSS